MAVIKKKKCLSLCLKHAKAQYFWCCQYPDITKKQYKSIISTHIPRTFLSWPHLDRQD